jgi:hypothetical protein
VNLNAQGQVSNQSQIEILIKESKPSIVCLKKTHVTENVFDSELSTSNRNNTNNNSIDVFICEKNRISDHETLKIDLNKDESDKNTKK